MRGDCLRSQRHQPPLDRGRSHQRRDAQALVVPTPLCAGCLQARMSIFALRDICRHPVNTVQASGSVEHPWCRTLRNAGFRPARPGQYRHGAEEKMRGRAAYRHGRGGSARACDRFCRQSGPTSPQTLLSTVRELKCSWDRGPCHSRTTRAGRFKSLLRRNNSESSFFSTP